MNPIGQLGAASALSLAALTNPAAADQPSPSLPPGTPATAAALGPGFMDGHAEMDGVRLHYVTGGEGPPVLLVPGWPETWWAWRHVMPVLAQRYTVVAVETRGMGQSSRPTSGYDMATVARDVVGLMARLGHRRFRYVGHDIGVWIGYAAAIDHPDAIESAALIDSDVPGLTKVAETASPKTANTRGHDAIEGMPRPWHHLFNQIDDLPESLTQGRERSFLGWFYSNYGYRTEAIATDEYVRAYSMPGAMRAGFAYYRAMPETIAQNRRRMATRLAMPLLAVGGAFGTADAAETTLRPHADDLTGAVLPACGHYVPEECPDGLLEKLLPFLEGRRAKP